MTKDEFIERHVAICTKDNVYRPNGKRRGGVKRVHAKSLWKTCAKYGIDPKYIVHGHDLYPMLAMGQPA